MAIESDLFGSYVGEINISVGGININISFAAGGINWDYLGREKWFKIGGGDGRWCQVSKVLLGALGVIEELLSPCDRRGLAG